MFKSRFLIACLAFLVASCNAPDFPKDGGEAWLAAIDMEHAEALAKACFGDNVIRVEQV